MARSKITFFRSKYLKRNIGLVHFNVFGTLQVHHSASQIHEPIDSQFNLLNNQKHGRARL